MVYLHAKANRNSPSTHVHYTFPPPTPPAAAAAAGVDGNGKGGFAAVAVQICVPAIEVGASNSNAADGGATAFTYYMAAGFAGLCVCFMSFVLITSGLQCLSAVYSINGSPRTIQTMHYVDKELISSYVSSTY